MSRAPLSKRWRRLRMGLATVTGAARRGWFIPYRYADGIPDAAERAGYPALLPLFAGAETAFGALLDEAGAHAETFETFRTAEPPRPRWGQSWYPRLDGLAAYTMLRARRPTRLVEVGSGHSTRFFAAAAADGAFPLALTAIDPAPRADLGRVAGVSLLRTTVQAAGAAPFAALAPGDVLAVDSSHIAMPGSDVDWLFAHVLPRLPAGILLCVHDIFLPDPYPAAWRWRAYNEQGMLAAMLTGGGWRPLWASHYAARHMPERVAASIAGALPLPDGAVESALWLEKTAPALDGS